MTGSRAYSGQNELYYLGAPPASATTVIVVGYRQDEFVNAPFASCQTVGHFDNEVGIDNEEQGLPIRVCRDPRGSWRELWPAFQHFDRSPGEHRHSVRLWSVTL